MAQSKKEVLLYHVCAQEKESFRHHQCGFEMREYPLVSPRSATSDFQFIPLLTGT